MSDAQQPPGGDQTPTDPPPDPSGPPRSRPRAEPQRPGRTARKAPSPASARRALQDEDARKAELDRIREEHEHSARVRKRVLIGGGVAVGLVAIVGVSYAVAESHRTTDAHCVDDQNRPVPPSNCDTRYGTGATGIFLLGGRQYHYYYGGRVGSTGSYTGGTVSAPSRGTIKGPNGETVSRGGFGGRSGGGAHS